MSNGDTQYNDTSDQVGGDPNSPTQQANDPYAQPGQFNQQSSEGSDQPQSAVGGISPEIPTTYEEGEQVVQPEITSEAPASPEQTQMPEEKGKEGSSEQDELIKSPQQESDEQKFENPFSVYGYQASKKVVDQATKGKGRNSVSGDVSQAKTWLLVLLGKLIKMRK